ncbi:transposase [Nonomuraea sp. NPDC050790]|uniref:transposase n=1 Tax=Nonomuraea sp. NPDC050790 TaxID=3364371 RepID=UPI0037A9639D
MAWRDIPERYGARHSLFTRFRGWAIRWHLRRHAARRPGAGGCSRGHRLAGGGGFHRRARPSARGRASTRGHRPGGERADHALGRSRGGLTSKIHLACDGRERPLAFLLTGGNVHDCTRLQHLLAAIQVPRIGPGRVRTRPDHVIADNGYSSREIRTHLRRRHHPHHPRASRPDRRPHTPRPQRRTTTQLRPRALQAAQRRRTLLQPTQAVPRPGHPLRQDRHLLHRHRHDCLTPALAVIFETGSRASQRSTTSTKHSHNPLTMPPASSCHLDDHPDQPADIVRPPRPLRIGRRARPCRRPAEGPITT